MVFKILAKIKMTQNKNQLSGCHFEMVQYFNFFVSFLFLQNYDFLIAHAYMVQISLQNSGGESGFLRGDSMDTPLWTLTGVKVPWSLKGAYSDPIGFF